MKEVTLSTALNAFCLWHLVLLPMNLILAKECEETNSPTPRKLTFIQDWNFFEQLWRHRRKLQTMLIQSTVENRAKKCQILQSRLLKLVHFTPSTFMFLLVDWHVASVLFDEYSSHCDCTYLVGPLVSIRAQSKLEIWCKYQRRRVAKIL